MDMESKDYRIIQRVRDYVQKYSCVGGFHGIEHWDRVYRNGQLLAASDVNSLVVGLFAYLHDSCRDSDDDDLQHGSRAAAFVDEVREELLWDVCDEEIALLKEACRFHTTSQRTGNPTIDVCFDADRLDLGRVGIIPDPDKMATDRGKTLASVLLCLGEQYHCGLVVGTISPGPMPLEH